jgi:hypothetical protein
VLRAEWLAALFSIVSVIITYSPVNT